MAGGPSNYTTGAVNTWGKASWRAEQGTFRVCISARLPGVGSDGSSQGLWPAHWLMPHDDTCDPDEGEMDIMEMVNGNGDYEATYHWETQVPQPPPPHPPTPAGPLGPSRCGLRLPILQLNALRAGPSRGPTAPTRTATATPLPTPRCPPGTQATMSTLSSADGTTSPSSWTARSR